MLKSFILLQFYLWMPFFLHAQTRYLDEVFSEVEIIKDIPYSNAINFWGQNQTLYLDLYLPKGDLSPVPRPCIIWAHGGAFVVGTKDQIEITPFPTAFAKRGFVCASIQYRLGASAFPDAATIFQMMIRAMQDGKAAVRFFRANANTYNIDTNHIFFGGSSAGGITALNIAYLSNYAEFQQIYDSTLILSMGGLEGGNGGSAGYASNIHGVIGLCAAIPKLEWIQSGDIPVALSHGDQDNTVPLQQGNVALQGFSFPVQMYGSASIDSFANTIGVSSDLQILYGKGHTPYAWEPPYADTVVQFLAPVVYKWLGNQVNKENEISSPFLIQTLPDQWRILAPDNQPYTITISDLLGKTLLNIFSTGNYTIPRTELPEGIFLLNINCNSKTVFHSQKILNFKP